MSVIKCNACSERVAPSWHSYVLSVCLLRLVNPPPLFVLYSIYIRVFKQNPAHHSTVIRCPPSSLTSWTSKGSLNAPDYSNKGSLRCTFSLYVILNHSKGGGGQTRADPLPSLFARQQHTGQIKIFHGN